MQKYIKAYTRADFFSDYILVQVINPHFFKLVHTDLQEIDNWRISHYEYVENECIFKLSLITSFDGDEIEVRDFIKQCKNIEHIKTVDITVKLNEVYLEYIQLLRLNKIKSLV